MDVPLANLFVHVARNRLFDTEGETRARSASELESTALLCIPLIINGACKGNRTLVIITNAAVAWRSPSAFVNGTFARNDGPAFVWRVWQADWRVLRVTEFCLGLF